MKRTLDFEAVLIIFGQYCVTMRVTISIVTGDNRQLDGSFGKPKVFKNILPRFMMLSFVHHNIKFFPSHAFLRERRKKAFIRVRNRQDFENGVN